MTDHRWLFNSNNEGLFWQVGDNVFDPKTHARTFRVVGQHLVDEAGQHAYHIHGNHLSPLAGGPALHYSGD